VSEGVVWVGMDVDVEVEAVGERLLAEVVEGGLDEVSESSGCLAFSKFLVVETFL
jgi:hypothetical protein